MLRLLLDEHISPAVAGGVKRRDPTIDVLSLEECDGGRFLGQTDEVLLDEAASHGLTLVTYDRRTIPPLLKTRAESERAHGGVIFVDDKSIPPSQIGPLVRALERLARESGSWTWRNRVAFLTR